VAASADLHQNKIAKAITTSDGHTNSGYPCSFLRLEVGFFAAGLDLGSCLSTSSKLVCLAFEGREVTRGVFDLRGVAAGISG